MKCIKTVETVRKFKWVLNDMTKLFILVGLLMALGLCRKDKSLLSEIYAEVFFR